MLKHPDRLRELADAIEDVAADLKANVDKQKVCGRAAKAMELIHLIRYGSAPWQSPKTYTLILRQPEAPGVAKLVNKKYEIPIPDPLGVEGEPTTQHLERAFVLLMDITQREGMFRMDIKARMSDGDTPSEARRGARDRIVDGLIAVAVQLRQSETGKQKTNDQAKTQETKGPPESVTRKTILDVFDKSDTWHRNIVNEAAERYEIDKPKRGEHHFKYDCRSVHAQSKVDVEDRKHEEREADWNKLLGKMGGREVRSRLVAKQQSKPQSVLKQQS